MNQSTDIRPPSIHPSQSIETLTELFAAGGVRTQLVFVSARHSEIVGRAFLAAGVREFY
jgi:hypothetical protein